MNQPITYLSLKTAKASKIGQRSKGDIHYRILTDQTLKQLYIFITSNDDDGFYSKEIIPFAKVEQCVQDINPNASIASKLFKNAFIGQSNNNQAFLAAILREEKLIAPMDHAVRKHLLQPGWARWKADMLKDASKAKAYEPELKKKSSIAVNSTDSDSVDLDEAEMALLQCSSLDADPDDLDVEPILPSKKRPHPTPKEKRQ